MYTSDFTYIIRKAVTIHSKSYVSYPLVVSQYLYKILCQVVYNAKVIKRCVINFKILVCFTKILYLQIYRTLITVFKSSLLLLGHSHLRANSATRSTLISQPYNTLQARCLLDQITKATLKQLLQQSKYISNIMFETFKSSQLMLS